MSAGTAKRPLIARRVAAVNRKGLGPVIDVEPAVRRTVAKYARLIMTSNSPSSSAACGWSGPEVAVIESPAKLNASRAVAADEVGPGDRKSTRLNSSH